jgi:hypothetical protein
MASVVLVNKIDKSYVPSLPPFLPPTHFSKKKMAEKIKILNTFPICVRNSLPLVILLFYFSSRFSHFFPPSPSLPLCSSFYISIYFPLPSQLYPFSRFFRGVKAKTTVKILCLASLMDAKTPENVLPIRDSNGKGNGTKREGKGV